jgi:hypothetical protein
LHSGWATTCELPSFTEALAYLTGGIENRDETLLDFLGAR